MLDNGQRLVAEVQQVLDKGFQHCLALGKEMQEGVEQKFRGKTELLENRDELKRFLSPWFNQFYELMAETIFKVLRMLQPEHFENGRSVNLYFLPGYHSHLIGRRIFYRVEATGDEGPVYKTYGVGLCGDPLAGPERLERYYDCCHSRWYRYATMPTRPYKDILPANPHKHFLPASPYHWFAYQQPRISEDPYDLVASLTFSTIPTVVEHEDFPHHKVLNLSGRMNDSQEWGALLADMLNVMPHLHTPEWEFPARGDRVASLEELLEEEHLRPVRCLLISLWMHSVFKTEPPSWLDALRSELEAQQLYRMIDAISLARNDEVACDWGDQSFGRPGFRTWTTISLLPLVAPPPPAVLGPREHALQAHEASDIYRQTIGWATLLCSAPLDLPFISVVRQWIRTVYGMLRSVEVSVYLRNREPLDRAAQMVRTIPHDLHHAIIDAATTLLRRNPPDYDERRFILLALRAQGTLGHGICSAAPYPEKRKRLKARLLKTLDMDDQTLRNAFYRVAKDVERYDIRKEKHARITIDPPSSYAQIPHDTYATCLLLIGEMVRNYCEHAPPEDTSKLEITRDGHRLHLTLEGKAGNTPAGDAYTLLHNVLDSIELGEAKVERITFGRYRWRVSIALPPKEPAL